MSDSRRVLLTGARGMLGDDLCAVPRQAGWQVVAADLAEFDTGDRQATLAYVEARSPYAVINCAAYTAVDQAESELALSRPSQRKE